MNPTGPYDYIIVGAGSSGCVMAERLSSDPGNRVLLIEAGGWDRSPFITMPKGIAKLVTDPAHIWAYRVTQPRTGQNDGHEVWIRGRVVGGSSSINGMIWSRGEPADYDDWAALGCAGWDGATMTAAFRAIEQHGLGPSESRGGAGPVRVSPGMFRYPLADRMVAAGAQMGLSVTDDLNAVAGPRVGYYSHNIHRGRRQSAAVAFLKPALGRANLDVMTGTVVDRVRFDGHSAVGVTVRRDGGAPHDIACRGEVILSAGAMESPLILQRSGIGPAPVLRAAGVDVLVDRADVGARMREHLGYSMPHRLARAAGINGRYRGLGLAASVAQYYLTRTGPLATGPFEVGAFLSVADPHGRTDLQLYLGGYSFALSDDNHPVPLGNVDALPGMTVSAALLRLTSEGSVAITGPDAGAAPDIRPNWLSTDADCQTAIATLRAMRRFAAQPALAADVAHELLPGTAVESDEQIVDSFRKLATCGLHATGSARMGGDAGAVVDPDLKVRGVEGVRVVDCSVMPAPVSGNTNAPAMALAWQAARRMGARVRAQ